MTNDTDYRGKLRAVFLAAIMVVSIFGAGMAFTGSAAAQASSNGIGDFQTQITADGTLQDDVIVENVQTDGSPDQDYRLILTEDGSDTIIGDKDIDNGLEGENIAVTISAGTGIGDGGNTVTARLVDETDDPTTGTDTLASVNEEEVTGPSASVVAASSTVPYQDFDGSQGSPLGAGSASDLAVSALSVESDFSDYQVEVDVSGQTGTFGTFAADGGSPGATDLDVGGTIRDLEAGDEVTLQIQDASGNDIPQADTADDSLKTSDNAGTQALAEDNFDTASVASVGPATISNFQASDVNTGTTGATQSFSLDIDGVSFGGQASGGSGSDAELEFDLSSLTTSGADLTTQPASVITGSLDADGGDISRSEDVSATSDTVDSSFEIGFNPSDGSNSVTVNQIQVAGIDTSAAGTVDLSHVVDNGDADIGGTTSVTNNAFASLASSASADYSVGASSGQTPDATYNFQGSVVYQGQDTYVYGDDIEAGGSYSLRTVDAFDAGTVDSSSVVEELKVVPSGDVSSEFTSGAINEFNLDTNGDIIALDTADYEAGDYFVSGEDSNGNSLPTDGQLARSGTLEIAVQETSVSFAEEDQPSLNDDIDDSTVELDYSSGRDGFSTNVSANGDLDDEDLFNILAYSELVDTSQSDNLVSDGQLNSLIPDEPSLASEITEIRDDGTIVSGSSETDSAYEFFAAVDDDFREAHSVSIDDNADYDLNDVAEGYSFGSYNVQFYQPDEDDADEKVLLNSAGVIDEEDVRTIGIDENDYDVIFNALDTEAESTAQLSVQEQNLDASFEEGVTQDAAGDITSFNLTLEDNDEAWVQIGGESSDFVDVLYLEADDASEPLSVDINTRLLGTAASIDAVYDEGDNVDTIQSEMHGGIDASNNPSGPSLYGDDGAVGSFEAYLDAMEIIDTGGPGEDRTDQLIRPLQSTDYEIRVGSPDADVQVFDADDGGEAEDELASKTLELQQPEIGEITTHTAPEDDADATTDVSELVDAATPREEVAADDRLIVQVEATGIFGALVAGPDGSADTTTADDPDFDRLTEGASSQVLYDVTELRSEQVTFEVTADSSTGNQDALEVDLESASDSETFVVLDEANEQFFLVVDTSSDNSFANGDAPDEATDFTVNMEYDADNEDDRYEFSDSGGDDKDPFSFKSGTHQNYPYLQQGDTLSNSVAVTVAPRSVDYDNINENDVVQAENTAESVISGETNVAPGSEVSLRVQSTDASSSFRQGNDINITEDGSFETQFDLSGQEVGDEFDTNFRVEGSSTDSTNSVIVEEGTLSTAEPADEEEDTNETDTDGGEDADDGEEPADDGEEPADDGSADDGSTDDGTPGFGAVVALIALIGAALLAVRRQN